MQYDHMQLIKKTIDVVRKLATPTPETPSFILIIKYQLKKKWKINPIIYDVNGTWFLPRLFKNRLYISFRLYIRKQGR